MYKWSPYYRRYRSKWSPYRSTYKWSPLYNKCSSYWSPLYNKYSTYWSPLYNKYSTYWPPLYNKYSTYWSPLYNKYRTYWSPLYSRYRWSPRYYRYLTDRYYNYRYSPLYRKYYFDDTYLDLKNKMNMFKSFLDSLPKNRSEMVNHLEIPDDILKNRSYSDVGGDLGSLGSMTSSVCSCEDLKPRPRSPGSTDSSISLSRAMTDSEIDYGMFRRIRDRRQSDPFCEIDQAMKAFPDEYLVSINNYQNKAPAQSSSASSPKRERPLHNEDLLRRMERYFDDECKVFGPDDPGLLDLLDAIDDMDLKTLDTDLI